jgi:hypothetical protein
MYSGIQYVILINLHSIVLVNKIQGFQVLQAVHRNEN